MIHFTLMRYVGIDPGKQGAIAWLDYDGPEFIGHGFKKISQDNAELFGVLATLNFETPCRVVLEHVSTMPRDGRKGAFTFGEGFGKLCMGLDSLDIKYQLIRPKEWQKALGCLSGGDKDVLWDEAKRLFPDFNIFKYAADAYLLAELSRRQHFDETNGVNAIMTLKAFTGEYSN